MKTQLEARRKPRNAELAELRRKARAAEKAGEYTGRFESRIADMVKERNLFKTGTVPVRFNSGLIVNGTLIKQYVKKCPKGQLEARLDREELIISHKTGAFTFFDMSGYYGDMKLPKGEDLLDELGIRIVYTR